MLLLDKQYHFQRNSVVLIFLVLHSREQRCCDTCFASFQETTLLPRLLHWIYENTVVPGTVALSLREQHCWGVCKARSAGAAQFPHLEHRIHRNNVVPVPRSASGRLQI